MGILFKVSDHNALKIYTVNTGIDYLQTFPSDNYWCIEKKRQIDRETGQEGYICSYSSYAHLYSIIQLVVLNSNHFSEEEQKKNRKKKLKHRDVHRHTRTKTVYRAYSQNVSIWERRAMKSHQS